jgi:hypothetical protein
LEKPQKGDSITETTTETTTDVLASQDDAGKKERKDADIFTVLEAFRTTGANKIPMFANTTQRKAAEQLVKAYGLDEVIAMVARAALAIVAGKRGDRYAPTITTPTMLVQKWAALEKWVAIAPSAVEELTAEQIREIHARRYAA